MLTLATMSHHTAPIAVRERIVLPLLTIQQYALRESRRRKAVGADEAG